MQKVRPAKFSLTCTVAVKRLKSKWFYLSLINCGISLLLQLALTKCLELKKFNSAEFDLLN